MEGKDCFFGVVSRLGRLLLRFKFNRRAAVVAVGHAP